ncbi:hypothetical protein V9K67_24925 [Paraflavisolibacter sp. H34]|uniref:hypothetical protein n=1 Tax=Huijunlia imazamoxiresistens TaxID=3127457 RepID=UPI00301B638F
MTLFEFNALREEEKARLLAEAVRLAHREDDRELVLLFQIDGFYVEVYRDKEQYDITRIRSFTSTDLLDPYLAGINISGIIGLLNP